MKSMLIALCVTAGWLFAAAAPATVPAPATVASYNPLQIFGPLRYHYPANEYRSGNGTPGPAWWENRADYEIHATLDPDNKTLKGKETITYSNNSPSTLHFLWIQLDQNRYRKDARANFTRGHEPKPERHTRGYQLDKVAVEGSHGLVPVRYVVSDTRMRVDLPRPLKADGGKLKLHIVYHYAVPASSFGGRNDWYKSKNGPVFEMAQWYPRMCVFDDLRGWDTLPFLNNEFYLEYGNFDYYLTVPWNLIVVSDGKLVNPDKVLTQTERKRLNTARHSDKTVMIIKPGEIGKPATRPVHKGTLTWHFRMNDTRDVAWGASKAYIWDAARINLPQGKMALAMSAYPIESIEHGAGWKRSTEYLKASVEYFSTWYPYPYPKALAEAGTVGGMEYPGAAFDWWKAKPKTLYWITAHEIGHTWFPMIVGSNERRAAWMDEGFNTFLDVLADAHFNHGEYAPKRDSEYAPGGGNPVDEIQSVLDDPNAPPIETRPDVIPPPYRHPVTYFKTALGLMLLRNQILGANRFDPAFKGYIRAWVYKHPSPADFFRYMDSAAGEDLSWFWREWFRHNWKLDMAIKGVKYVGDKPAKGALVTVANLDKMVMPATLQVTYADGSKKRVRIPVATWMTHKKFPVLVTGNKRVRSATIDPDHVIPDDNRANNIWPAKSNAPPAATR